MGGGEIKRSAFPNVHALFAEMIPKQARVFEIRRVLDHRVGAEMRQADRHADFLEMRIQRAAKPANALFHFDLHTRSFAHQMLHHPPCCGEG